MKVYFSLKRSVYFKIQCQYKTQYRKEFMREQYIHEKKQRADTKGGKNLSAPIALSSANLVKYTTGISGRVHDSATIHSWLFWPTFYSCFENTK